MFRKSLPAFAAGAVFAVAIAGGGVSAFAGSHGSDQRTTSKARTGAYDFYGEAFDLNDNGYTDTIAAVAQCPRGTQMTGGGGVDGTSTGWMVANAPMDHESWLFAVVVNEDVSESPEDLTASVVCWSASGRNLGGSYRPATTRPVPARELAALRAAVAARTH
jgi:hypothetical protein